MELMSAVEIIEQIRALPKSEQAMVADFLSRELAPAAETPAPGTKLTFEEAKAYVFDNYGDLLKKLAQ